MAHGGGLDPHFFDWPTLDDVPRRAVPGVATRRRRTSPAGSSSSRSRSPGSRPRGGSARAAYGVTAGAIAAAVTAVDATHVAFSHAAVTDIPLTTFTTVALALLVTGRFELAGAAIGLATAAKYPAVVLVVPLVVVCWGRWRRLAVSALLAGVAFFAASPFVIIDGRSTWSALRRIQAEHRRGWLGFEHDHVVGLRVRAHALERDGPGADHRRHRLDRRAGAPQLARRPRARLVRRRLLPDAAPAALALPALRAPARARARRARRPDARARARDAAAARRAADVVDPRRLPPDAHRHADRRGALDRARTCRRAR